MKSIDINSVVANGKSLMDDLRKSYPMPMEEMRHSLSNLPEEWTDLNQLASCARSQASSEFSQVNSDN